MMKLTRTLMHLDSTEMKTLKRLAQRLTKAESRRVTVSELVRRAIREFLARQKEG